MRRYLYRRPLAEINVVPYIDVMLVLLVIFMITAPLLAQGVHVDLPKAQAAALSREAEPPIVVSIDTNGRYYLNIAADPQQPLAPNELARRVAAEVRLAQEAGGQRQVLVKGDRAVPYGQVVQAMVMLQQVGVNNVGLMTSPGEQ